MKHLYRLLCLFLVFSFVPVGAQVATVNFTAHEWGTFTSLVGSNGSTVDGMYHEDEPLPNFVHGFGELVSQPIFQPDPQDPCRRRKIPCEFLERNSVTQKMETPVIYFYSSEEVDVNVDVRFPGGAITETYPGPTFTMPSRASEPVLAHGHTIFNVKVYPLGYTPRDAQIQPVEPGNIYAHARIVNSSLVRANNEMEKFIFYRGAGNFQPEITVTSKLGGLRVRPSNEVPNVPPMILLDVAANGSVRAVDLIQFSGKRDTVVSPRFIETLRNHSLPLSDGIFDRKLAFDRIGEMLLQAGLTSSEAQAMIQTWEHGYLNVPGLRLLYILPSHEVERLLPLNITPSPSELKRVFVGRLEVMLDLDEEALMYKVIAAGDLIDVVQLGRFAESLLRRTLDVYREHKDHTNTAPNPAVVDLFHRLIERAKTYDRT